MTDLHGDLGSQHVKEYSLTWRVSCPDTVLTGVHVLQTVDCQRNNISGKEADLLQVDCNGLRGEFYWRKTSHKEAMGNLDSQGRDGRVLSVSLPSDHATLPGDNVFSLR